MKGSIRVFVGLLLTMGAVGGLDAATDAHLLPLIAIAALGLYSMDSGTKAMEQ